MLAIQKWLWWKVAMNGSDGGGVGRWLREVEVRPVRGVLERRRWDGLMSERHHLPFRGLFGRSLRHVAVRGEAWLALLGWQAGAFKVGGRDAWNRLDAGAAVPAAAPGREQRPLCGAS